MDIQISVEELMAIIGKQQVEIYLLNKQLAQFQQAQLQAKDAKVPSKQ